MGSGTSRDLKAAQPWGFLDCTVRERIYLRHEFGLSHLVLPQGFGFQEGIYRQKCWFWGLWGSLHFCFITHMFQLPPRTSANCIVLLIIKAKENPQERQCTGVPHRNCAFYCWNKKINWMYKKEILPWRYRWKCFVQNIICPVSWISDV